VNGLQGNDFYAEVYARAHASGLASYESTVATPMLVSVNDAAPQVAAECGSAFVAVNDARTGFARWLLGAGLGERRIGGGVMVFAPNLTQSFEKARNYAQAFAYVLRENDLPCDIVTVDD